MLKLWKSVWKEKKGRREDPFLFASENEVLIRDRIQIGGENVGREVIGSKPLHICTVKKSKRSFSKLKSELNEQSLAPVRNLRQLDKNHTSIVLWINVGDINVLLGADLEELGDKDDGWETNY